MSLLSKFCLAIGLILTFGLGISNAEESRGHKGEILQKFRLIVKGLDCKKCIPDVEKPLMKIQGVREAKVTEFNPSGSMTDVEVVPEKVSGNQLILALQMAGLEAEINSIGKPREVVFKKAGFGLFNVFD